MNAFVFAGFVVAAGVGAALRFAVTQWVNNWLGTLAVNGSGSLALGWLVASGPSQRTSWIIGTALCGTFTTFSTFALDASEGTFRRRLMVIVATLVVCIGTAAIGVTLA